MDQRVQRKPPHPLGRIIAKAEGRKGMGCFVEGERNRQNEESEQQDRQIIKHDSRS
jgi:hypothetical protein